MFCRIVRNDGLQMQGSEAYGGVPGVWIVLQRLGTRGTAHGGAADEQGKQAYCAGYSDAGNDSACAARRIRTAI